MSAELMKQRAAGRQTLGTRRTASMMGVAADHVSMMCSADTVLDYHTQSMIGGKTKHACADLLRRRLQAPAPWPMRYLASRSHCCAVGPRGRWQAR